MNSSGHVRLNADNFVGHLEMRERALALLESLRALSSALAGTVRLCVCKVPAQNGRSLLGGRAGLRRGADRPRSLEPAILVENALLTARFELCGNV
jgi:hypothetical protein